MAPKIIVAGLLLTGLAAAAPGAVVAQASEGTDSLSTIEEVLVTAQRRTRDLQDTAMSASVLTGDMLEDMGVVDLYALQYAVPSVTIGDFGSANEFNIRGIGRNQVDIDVPSGVVIYRDGAPTIAGYFQGEPYFDIQSVEVLRGPQGTFVGKSAAGGAVFINTSDPELDRSSGRIQAGFGNNARRELTAVLNQPLSETVAVRVAGNLLDADDYYDEITGDFTGDPAAPTLKSIRGSVLWEPSLSFTAKVKVDFHDLDFGGNVVSSPGFPIYEVEQNGDIAYEDESLRMVADLAYTFQNGVKVRSLTAYQDLDSVNNLDLNGSLPDFYQFMSNFEVDIKSQEIDIVSPDDGPFRWVLGALYFEQEADVPPWQEDGFTFTGGPAAGANFPWLTSPWLKYEDEWSVFGHVAFDLTDTVELEVGARYSDYYTDQFTDWVIGDGITPPTGVFAPAGTQELSEDSVDGQVALNWRAGDDHFVYGVISRGHVTGGINIFPPFRIYDEMAVINYELGWKANWADNQVRTQTTVFLQDFDDFIVNFEQQAAFGLPGQDNRNAPGDSTIWGIETSLQASLESWQVDLNLAYLDSDIGTFEGVVDPIATAENGGVPVAVDLSGKPTPYTPEITASGGVAYRFNLGGYALVPRVDVSYVAETRTKLWDSPLVELESRTLTNAQIVLLSPDNRWSVTAWGTNVFDERYVAGIQNLASLIYAGRPRQYGLRVNFNF